MKFQFPVTYQSNSFLISSPLKRVYWVMNEERMVSISEDALYGGFQLASAILSRI